MKKAKFYTTICLIVVMIVASCPAVFASDALPYVMSWLFNPVEGHGFIIKDYETGNTALVNHKGAVVPSSSKYFSYVDESGIIDFYDYENGGAGIMDVNGNIIIAPGEYDSVYSLSDNLFAYGVTTDEYYAFGVIDRDHNEIIPAEFDYIRAQELIYCSSDDGNFIYDMDGDLIAHYPYNDGNTYVTLLSADDRYLLKEYDPSTERSSTKIVHIDGTLIASIDRSVYDLSDTVLCGSYYSESDRDYSYNYYDLDGNLIGSESGEQAWREGSLYERYSLNGEIVSRYKIQFMSDREVVLDGNGNIVFDNPDKASIWDIINEKFIKVYRDGYYGLYTIDGTPIIYPDYYDDISYCEELDIFAFEKDLQVSIAKISPAEPTISVTVYGNPVEFDQPPVLKEGRTLVPVRAIAEALGSSVEWDEATQTVTATLGDTVVKLVINSKQMLVNGNAVEIDVPAEIINSRTLIPVRAISEAFGCNVDWDGDNYRVIID